MNRAALAAELAATERHIRDGERHLLRQREIVAELEPHGRGRSRTTFEASQSKHLNHRARLLQALREMT
jgi:hypothetical protein